MGFSNLVRNQHWSNYTNIAPGETVTVTFQATVLSVPSSSIMGSDTIYILILSIQTELLLQLYFNEYRYKPGTRCYDNDGEICRSNNCNTR